MITESILTAAGALVVAWKLDIKKVLNFDIPIDIALTAGLMYCFSGTYSGMLTAMIAGLLVSVVFMVLKRTIGYKKLSFDGFKPVWTEVSV